jgi:hypothetical protein
MPLDRVYDPGHAVVNGQLRTCTAELGLNPARVWAGVHTATAGRFPVRRQSFTRRRVQITACGRRPAGTCRYRAGLSGISRGAAAPRPVPDRPPARSSWRPGQRLWQDSRHAQAGGGLRRAGSDLRRGLRTAGVRGLRTAGVRGLRTAGVVALEDGQQVSEISLSAEFLDQANIGFDPVVLADERLMRQNQSFIDVDRVERIGDHACDVARSPLLAIC